LIRTVGVNYGHATVRLDTERFCYQVLDFGG